MATARPLSVPEIARSMGRRYDGFLEDLRAMVGIDCGTFTPVGVNAVADLCEERFRRGGWEVERATHRPEEGHRPLGDLVIGRLPAPSGPRIVLIGHTDTVFPEGTVAERPFQVEGDRAYGPGTADMKAGLLAGFHAVELLQEAGAVPGPVTFVCNPDEEIGSPFSRAFIEDAARDADVAFVLEAARESGAIVSARKGVTDFRIEVSGRSAHAGVEPERGSSAVLEAAHKTVALHELNGRWPGVTVNVGVADGGTRANVVADRCVLHVDLRAPEEDALRQAEEAVLRLAEAATVPGTAATVRMHANHRPMARTEATGRLAALARDVGGELGLDVPDVATGGASDANTTAALGVPTLDGLGPVGGDAHSAGEWLDLSSVVPRVALLAGLLARVVEVVPARARA